MAVKSKEDEMFDLMAKEIAREIDEGILSTICVESGWTPVRFTFKDNFQATDIQIWLQNECSGKYRRYGSDYLFETKQDAEWFILRWS